MANEGLDQIIADTYEALGFHARAAMMRDGAGAVEEDTRYDDFVAAIVDLLDEVPANTDRHKHVKNARAEGDRKATHACWLTRAQCLAEKLRGMIG